MACIDFNEATTQEQVFFDEHQRKTMEFMYRLEYLLAKSQPRVPAQVSANDRLVERQLDLLSGSMRSIRGVLENPELIDIHILANYMNKIRSLEVELQDARREILLLDDYGESVRKASDIGQLLFDLLVAISHLMKKAKKEPFP